MVQARHEPRAPHLGSVTQFDEDRGWGTVTEPGGASYAFHCTAIADGSRRIAEGTVVQFAVVPGHLGRMEARSLQQVAGG